MRRTNRPPEPLPMTPDALVAIFDALDSMIGESPALLFADRRVVDSAISLCTTIERMLATEGAPEPPQVMSSS